MPSCSGDPRPPKKAVRQRWGRVLRPARRRLDHGGGAMPVRGRSYSDPTSLGIATTTATAAAACPAPRNGITTGNALAQALASRMAAESSKRDCSQEPVSSFSSDHDSVASDSKASDRSRAEDRRGPKARASRVSPARGPPVAKRSSGSSAPLPTDDSGSDSGARAPHRHQRSGYDSEGGGRALGVAGVPAGAARAARKPAGGAIAGNLADPTRTLQGRRIPTTRRIWTLARRATAL